MTIQQENKERKEKKAPVTHGMIRKEQHRDEDLSVFYTLTVLKVSVAELRSSHLLLGECAVCVFCYTQGRIFFYKTATNNNI